MKFQSSNDHIFAICVCGNVVSRFSVRCHFKSTKWCKWLKNIVCSMAVCLKSKTMRQLYVGDFHIIATFLWCRRLSCLFFHREYDFRFFLVLWLIRLLIFVIWKSNVTHASGHLQTLSMIHIEFHFFSFALICDAVLLFKFMRNGQRNVAIQHLWRLIWPQSIIYHLIFIILKAGYSMF